MADVRAVVGRCWLAEDVREHDAASMFIAEIANAIEAMSAGAQSERGHPSVEIDLVLPVSAT